MPLDLARLAAGTAPLEIAYGDEVLRLTYRPERVTGQTFGLLVRLEASATPAGLGELYDEVARLVAAWELTEDGAPLALTRAAVDRLSVPLLFAILAAILRDAGRNPTPAPAPTRATGATSNGSSPTVGWVGAPTGSPSSSPPDGPLFIRARSPDSPAPDGPFAGVPG